LSSDPVVAGQQRSGAIENAPEILARLLEKLDGNSLKSDSPMSKAEAPDYIAGSALIRVHRWQPESPVPLEIPLGVLRPM